MEKKIGKNVSSGAKKVEAVEEKKQYTAEGVDPVKTKTTKTSVSTATKKATAKKPATTKRTTKHTTASKTRKAATKRAAKAEKRAAEKRVEAAKEKAAKKEKRLMHRAELKQKKIEKKAELKAKRLARKQLIAEKREERKAKLLERRAALKEKRVERHAERVARREMLKNESKTEKQKRLAREKKERLALRRQRQEAREKARENKLKARDAARARKSEERKHKREQHTERKSKSRGFGGWLAAVISLGTACLVLGAIVTAGAFRMNEVTLSAENGYRATLFEMVSGSEGLDNSLEKLRVASGANEQRELLTNILVDTAVMESALERMPLEAMTSSDISSLINRTSSYARMLLDKIADGEPITQKEINTLNYLYELNSSLYSELNTLATQMTEKDFRAFVNGKEGALSEKFAQMGEGTRREPDEGVEAPFSGQGNVGENALTGLEEITSARAEELAKEYFSAYHVRDIRFTGETTAKDFTCYNFVLTDENDVEIFAEITKNGGKLAFFDTYEECTQKNFDLETCDTLAKEFLSGLGIENVEAVWLSDGGMVANLTYVSNDGGVRAYPDSIRVRVCEEKGRVVGIDARGYLVNYHERQYEDAMSEEEAKNYLSVNLTPESAKLALIPVAGGERLAYEFVCTYGEEQFIAYVDAISGEELKLLRVRNSAQGTYLE